MMTSRVGTRRPLGETLADVAAGALESATHTGLIVGDVEVTLPIELAFTGSAPELLGDVPRTVTRTAFDARPSRIVAVLRREGVA